MTRRLIMTRASDIKMTAHPAQRDWGPWTLDGDPVDPELRLDGGRRYAISLVRCRTPAEVLDWICQVAKKNWADDAVLAGLVRALNDILNPQANLCSFGRSKPLTIEQIRELARGALR